MIKVYIKQYWILLIGITALTTLIGLQGLLIGLLLLHVDSRAKDRKSFKHQVNLEIAKAKFKKSNKKKIPQIVSKEYSAYLISDEWKALRHRVIHRDRYRCTTCSTKKNLQVHHLNYGGIFDNMNFQLNQLQTLCVSCHNSVHGRGN